MPRRTPAFARLLRAAASAIGLWPDPRREHVQREVRRITREIRARYDLAQTTEENRKHWSLTDNLSANASNSGEVRRKLRERTRYERDNNSYCQGIVETLAADLIGTGPRLQLQTPSEEANRFIEREFGFWSDATDLAGKLQTVDAASHVDGEGFASFISNPRLGTPVQLDLFDFECDHVTTPTFTGMERFAVDGIRFDAARNPIEYDVLPDHPGDTYATSAQTPRVVPASQILHWFRPKRPGQLRGIPTLTPAVELFAQLRRYSRAVLMAAEIAAELAAFIETDQAPSDSGDNENIWEVLEIVRGQITTLPQAWKISQLNPTQPTTGFSEFVNTILREIARCLSMPWGLASGDSSAYNYASGRLDVQIYQRRIKVDRARFERRHLDRLFLAWLDEAVLISRYLPIQGLPPFAQWRWAWHWDQFEHVDPTKEANAIATLLQNNATTMEAIYAAKGQDWRQAFEELAIEKREMTRLGLSPAPATAPAGAPPGSPPGAAASIEDPANAKPLPA